MGVEPSGRVVERISEVTEQTTAGPSHSRRLGIAKAEVLPEPGGPHTTTDFRGLAATRCRPRSHDMQLSGRGPQTRPMAAGDCSAAVVQWT
jgi:hypothetical protein